MLTTAELQTVIGQAAYGPDGDKLGKIGQVWVDDDSAEAEFVTVQTGLFGTHETFVPVKDATLTGDSVQVPFTKEQVKNAPQLDADGGHITADDGRQIYDHYGLPYSGAAAGAGNRSGLGDQAEAPPKLNVAGTPWGTADPADAAGRPVGDPGDPLTSERDAVDRATSAELAATAPPEDGFAPDALQPDPQKRDRLRAETDPLATSSATGAPDLIDETVEDRNPPSR